MRIFVTHLRFIEFKTSGKLLMTKKKKFFVYPYLLRNERVEITVNRYTLLTEK